MNTSPANPLPDLNRESPAPASSRSPGTSRLNWGTLSLWALAGVLGGALALTLSTPTSTLPSESSALADMGAWNNEMSAVTLSIGGTDDLLVVLDARSESLLVYSILNQRSVQFRFRERLPALFAAARVNDTNRPGGRGGGGGGGTGPIGNPNPPGVPANPTPR
jgi:hypothetical protein